MKFCNRCRDQLGEYLDGTLPASEREKVAAHLEECAECRAELKALQTTRDALQSWSPVAAPEDLRMRVRQALQNEPQRQESPSWWSSFNLLRPNKLVWSGAATFSAFLLYILVSPNKGEYTTLVEPTAEPVAVSKTEAPAAEKSDGNDATKPNESLAVAPTPKTFNGNGEPSKPQPAPPAGTAADNNGVTPPAVPVPPPSGVNPTRVRPKIVGRNSKNPGSNGSVSTPVDVGAKTSGSPSITPSATPQVTKPSFPGRTNASGTPKPEVSTRREVAPSTVKPPAGGRRPLTKPPVPVTPSAIEPNAQDFNTRSGGSNTDLSAPTMPMIAQSPAPVTLPDHNVAAAGAAAENGNGNGGFGTMQRMAPANSRMMAVAPNRRFAFSIKEKKMASASAMIMTAPIQEKSAPTAIPQPGFSVRGGVNNEGPEIVVVPVTPSNQRDDGSKPGAAEKAPNNEAGRGKGANSRTGNLKAATRARPIAPSVAASVLPPTRQFELSVVAPRDLTDARLRLEIPAALRFEASSPATSKILWTGDLKDGQAQSVSLDLINVHGGEKIILVLEQIGEDAESKPVETQTLILPEPQ